MIDNDLNRHVQEFQSEGINTLNYSLIHTCVKITAYRYPAEVYSPNSVWDTQSIMDVTQSFVLDWLLARGRYEYYLLTVDTYNGLKQGIISEFKKYLTNEKRRSEYSNLFTRMKAILLNNNEFELISGDVRFMKYTIWGLVDSNFREEVQDIDQVLEAMFDVDIPPAIKYRPDSKKMSPIIATVDLKKLLFQSMYKLEQCVGFDLLIQGLRYRLNLLDIDAVALEETINGAVDVTYEDVISESENIENIIISQLSSDEIFEVLSDRQRTLLAWYLATENPTLEGIGAKLGISKSLVHDELRAIQNLIKSSTPNLGQEHAEQILLSLGDLCAQHISLDNTISGISEGENNYE